MIVRRDTLTDRPEERKKRKQANSVVAGKVTRRNNIHFKEKTGAMHEPRSGNERKRWFRKAKGMLSV
jgi:hypothetical protein